MNSYRTENSTYDVEPSAERFRKRGHPWRRGILISTPVVGQKLVFMSADGTLLHTSVRVDERTGHPTPMAWTIQLEELVA